MEILLVFVFGAALGGGVVWLISRSAGDDAQPALLEARHLAALAEVRQAEGAARAEVEAQLAAAHASIEGLHREVGAVHEQLKQTREQHAREAREREAAGAAESKVLQQMAPIAKSLTDMQRKVDEIEKQRSQQHGELAQQLLITRQTAEKSHAAAEALNSALRNNQKRGAYGEIQLESIIEAAGMLKRVDFTVQESITADSGARRPDVIIKLPGGKELAVDAKVPYAAFIEAHRADATDEFRAAQLKEHAKQVRAHVNALADREYFTGLKASPEATVAFIPSDAILNAAVDADPTLTDYAFSRGVVLATPGSLFTLLKGLAYSWRQENLAEEAQEIVLMGQELFRRLRKAAEHAVRLGNGISRVVKNYNELAGSLERSVLPQARRFESIEMPRLNELDDGTRQFVSPEFAALEGVERPELEFFEPERSAEGLDEVG